VNCRQVIFFDWDVGRRVGLQFGSEAVRFVLLSRDLLRFTRNAKILSIHPTLCEYNMFSCSRFLNNSFFHSHSERYYPTLFPVSCDYASVAVTLLMKRDRKNDYSSRFFRAEITGSSKTIPSHIWVQKLDDFVPVTVAKSWRGALSEPLFLTPGKATWLKCLFRSAYSQKLRKIK
jgi:hypothetical protein